MSVAPEHRALLRSIERRYIAEGQLALPAAPALLDHYTELVATHFENLARPLDEQQRAALRSLLAAQLTEAHQAAPQSNVLLRYHVERTPSAPIHYAIAVGKSTLEEEYEYWVATRVGPLFGKYPDAKVMDIAASLGSYGAIRVLDIGAGTGRNALPLARAGNALVALELSSSLSDVLIDDAAEAQLNLSVLHGDIFDPNLPLAAGSFELVIVAEVIPHLRSVEQLEALFSRVAEVLVPGGHLLVSAFLSKPGFVSDDLARQIAQICWSSFFVPDELSAAARRLGLELLSDEAVLDYERSHLPAQAFPPTRWFESWASGSDAFDVPHGTAPIELRWLLFRREA
jgi:SAM-dependent methyltransferase